MLRLGTFKLAQLFCAPYRRDVLLVLQRGHGACNVPAETFVVVPKGAFLIVQVQSVVGEEIGIVREVADKGLELAV